MTITMELHYKWIQLLTNLSEVPWSLNDLCDTHFTQPHVELNKQSQIHFFQAE